MAAEKSLSMPWRSECTCSSEVISRTRPFDKSSFYLYSVPSIASTFHGPESLCTALKKESQKWLEEGLDYFHHTGNRELEMVTAALKELQVKK